MTHNNNQHQPTKTTTNAHWILTSEFYIIMESFRCQHRLCYTVYLGKIGRICSMLVWKPMWTQNFRKSWIRLHRQKVEKVFWFSCIYKTNGIVIIATKINFFFFCACHLFQSLRWCWCVCVRDVCKMNIENLFANAPSIRTFHIIAGYLVILHKQHTRRRRVPYNIELFRSQ